MILETKHLRLVLAVAEHGSVTKAAGDLNLSQPALSQQLLLLESRLGTSLFHRVGKRMVPTIAGAQLRDAARGIVAELEALESGIRSIAQGRGLALRIGTQCHTVYHWLPALLGAYAQRYPQVDVHLVGDTPFPERALLDGRIDLAILTHAGHDARLRYLPLFEDEVVLVVPPDHHLADRSRADVADLDDERLITYASPSGSPVATQDYLREIRIHPRRVTEVLWTDAIAELVRLGHGVSLVARWAVAPALQAGWLRAIPFSENGLRRRWYAAVLDTPALGPHVADLVDTLACGPDATRYDQPESRELKVDRHHKVRTGGPIPLE
jgi:Transcriptional regulator